MAHIKYHPGYKAGKLTLIERLETVRRCSYGLFECECGNQVKARIRDVVSGAKVRCGSHACRFNDSGTYNGISLIEPTGRTKHNKMLYTALCHCGAVFEVKGTEVRQGKRKSCGCLQIANKRYKKGAKPPTPANKQQEAMRLWAGGLGRKQSGQGEYQ